MDGTVPSLKQQVTPSGPQLAYGLLNPGSGSQRVMVHAHRADEARALLAQARAEDESAIPESVNAGYLEEARGGWKPDRYGPIGGYARAFLVSLLVMGFAFGVFILLRAV
jgi:hypothetical protein